MFDTAALADEVPERAVEVAGGSLEDRGRSAGDAEPTWDGADQGPWDVVGRGADLEPGTLLAAYRAGVFPMPVARRGAPVWWCPARRGVLHPAELVASRSLVKSARRLEVRTDTAFEAVLSACAGTPRPGGWITKDIARAYLRLHSLGWAHSVEAWTPQGDLAGGLYGVAVGGLFAGESMFHEAGPWARDASKVALLGLTALLGDDAGRARGGSRLIDIQWLTPHLASLGARTMPRRDYLAALPGLVAMPLPSCWAG